MNYQVFIKLQKKKYNNKYEKFKILNQDFVEDDVLVNVDNNQYLSGDNEAA